MSSSVGGLVRPESGASPACLICGTALGGPLACVFRLVGVRRSTRNPNLCNRCNTHTEEGRLVELTVLFADLSSFTELTQELGAERTHAVVDAFLRSATYSLVRRGAFIDKYVGDAVMAFFNAPIRYPDHAARAVAAALEIQAELPSLGEQQGLELAASIGIASGWARVGRLGSDDGKDYTAIGDVVNLAARLESKAGSGEVVVDGQAYRQVADRFPDLAPESLTVKGFRDPVEVYRLGSGEESDGHRATAEVGDSGEGRRRAFSLGATLFAILGAPCAAVCLIGPLAVALGLGSLFGALSTNIFPALDAAPFRIPILIAATFGALANLYTLWHARRLRAEARAQERNLPMTSLERRRTLTTGLSAAVTLFVVAFELYSHQFVTHHPWP